MNQLFRAASAVAIATAFVPSFASAAANPATDAPAVAADASAASPDSASTVGEIIVTGTRQTGLRAVDSSAPVEFLDAGSLQRTAEPGLLQAIAQNVPSFNAQAFGGDLANIFLSAKLRGVSPNDTLVLIDGKRRHGTASLAVGAGSYQGGASADLSFIPLSAVDHIEVLEDGAAAQYGTDAIAGVVNIILKTKNQGGQVVLTAGQYEDGGGKSASGSFNIGITPVENAFLNLTFDSQFHGHSFRGDFDPPVVQTPYNTGATSYPQVTSLPNYPYLNRIAGDALSRINNFAYNSGYDISPETQIYSFGTYGRKYGESIENYRVPNQTVGKNGVEPYPNGYTPLETITENDYAATAGIRGGTPKTFTWDLSSTYGSDNVSVNVLNSINTALYQDTSTTTTNGFSPTNFHNGNFINSQWTNNLDLTKDFNIGAAAPLTVAGGLEYRHETYEIDAGDAASRYKSGSASYPGFSLTDAGEHDRDNIGVYLDFATSPISKLKVDAAVRFENYSDAGDTTVEKLTGRYDFTDNFAVRGTISTGFRAPTLAEEYYSATNVSPTAAFVQLPPNSAAAKLLGIDGLKPEKSTNYSVGFVAHANNGLTATLDVYQITIDNRILGSGELYGVNTSNPGSVIPAVNAAIAANGNVIDPTVTQAGVEIFTNGLNTQTRGAELVVSYASNFDHFGSVNWSLSGNYNETTITKVLAPPAQLASHALFDTTALSYVTDASPKFRLTAGAFWTIGKFSADLKESLYGPSSFEGSYDQATYFKNEVKTSFITDLELAYKIRSGLKFSVGANNLFNKYPDKINPALRQLYLLHNSTSYVGQYNTISPYGIDGGYYYGRLTLNF